jgi:hypothetical protein
MKIRSATFDEVEAAGIADVLHNEPGLEAYTIEADGVQVVVTGEVHCILGEENLVADVQVEDAVVEPVEPHRTVQLYESGGVWTVLVTEADGRKWDMNEGGEPCKTLGEVESWIRVDWRYHLGLTEEERDTILGQIEMKR